jgi:hypothetical protein
VKGVVGDSNWINFSDGPILTIDTYATYHQVESLSPFPQVLFPPMSYKAVFVTPSPPTFLSESYGVSWGDNGALITADSDPGDPIYFPIGGGGIWEYQLSPTTNGGVISASYDIIPAETSDYDPNHAYKQGESFETFVTGPGDFSITATLAPDSLGKPFSFTLYGDPIPEPSGWVLMLLGLGGLGGLLRSKPFRSMFGVKVA